MAINVTLGEVKPQIGKPFPKLMKSIDYGNIVYMIEPEKGIMLHHCGDGTNLTGVFYDGYNMEYFTDYNEPITIQNA